MSQPQQKSFPPTLNNDVIVFMTTFFLSLTLLLTSFNVLENHIYYFFFQLFIKSFLFYLLNEYYLVYLIF